MPIIIHHRGVLFFPWMEEFGAAVPMTIEDVDITGLSVRKIQSKGRLDSRLVCSPAVSTFWSELFLAVGSQPGF